MMEKLQEIGLSKKEAQIYLALAKQSQTTGNEIAKMTSSNRTATYNILQQLVEKGLVSYFKKQNKRYYKIADPENLLASTREKEKIISQLIKEIEKISPKKDSSKNVEIYEGVAGTKSLHEEIRKAKNLRILNANGLIFSRLPFAAPHIVKEESEKLRPRMIATQSMKETPLKEYKNFRLKFLPGKKENYATTFIFDEKIVIQMLRDKPFLIKIENKEIFEGYKQNFDLLWNKL